MPRIRRRQNSDIDLGFAHLRSREEESTLLDYWMERTRGTSDNTTILSPLLEWARMARIELYEDVEDVRRSGDVRAKGKILLGLFSDRCNVE